MEYFKDDGTPKNIVNINSLTKDGFRKYSEEVDFLKENDMYDDSSIRKRKKKPFSKRKINKLERIETKTFSKNITDSFVINENADNRFYYFRFNYKGKSYYKIGITSQSLKKRYKKIYLISPLRK